MRAWGPGGSMCVWRRRNQDGGGGGGVDGGKPSSEFVQHLIVEETDVCDVIYVRFGPYLRKKCCLLHGPTVLLLMYCYIMICLFVCLFKPVLGSGTYRTSLVDVWQDQGHLSSLTVTVLRQTQCRRLVTYLVGNWIFNVLSTRQGHLRAIKLWLKQTQTSRPLSRVTNR